MINEGLVIVWPSPVSASGVYWSREIDTEYQWTDDGFGNPGKGLWRIRDGTTHQISEMTSSHINNAMKHMIKQIGESTISGFKYQELLNELKHREVKEWDE